MSFFKNLSIQSNTILIIASIGLIKAPMVIRDILLTFYFGIDKNLDVYFYSLIFPVFFLGIFSAGLTAFFIPAYLSIKKEGKHAAMQFAGQVFVFMMVIIAFLVLSLAYTVPQLTEKLNPAFLEMSYYHTLLRWTWIFFIFSMLGIILSSLLQAEHRYFKSLYPQMLVASGSILSVVLFYKSLGVVSAILGSALGAMLCFAVYYFYCRRAKLIHPPTLKNPSEKIPIQLGQFWILILTFSIPCLMPLIDQYMASTLKEGSLSIFNYGTRIPDGLAEIFSSGLGVAVFSHFSQWHVESKNHLIVDATRKAVTLATLFILPLCAFILILAQPIISIIFERGAFSRNATLEVSRVLQFYSFFTYFSILSILGTRAISALKKNYFLLLSTLVALTVKVILNLIFVRFLGVAGLALANIGTLFLYCCLIYCFLAMKKVHIFEKVFISKLTVCSGGAALIAFILTLANQCFSSLSDLYQILIGFSILSVLFIFIFKVFIKYKIISISEFKANLPQLDTSQT